MIYYSLDYMHEIRIDNIYNFNPSDYKYCDLSIHIILNENNKKIILPNNYNHHNIKFTVNLKGYNYNLLLNIFDKLDKINNINLIFSNNNDILILKNIKDQITYLRLKVDYSITNQFFRIKCPLYFSNLKNLNLIINYFILDNEFINKFQNLESLCIDCKVCRIETIKNKNLKLNILHINISENFYYEPCALNNFYDLQLLYIYFYREDPTRKNLRIYDDLIINIFKYNINLKRIVLYRIDLELPNIIYPHNLSKLYLENCDIININDSSIKNLKYLDEITICGIKSQNIDLILNNCINAIHITISEKINNNILNINLIKHTKLQFLYLSNLGLTIIPNFENNKKLEVLYIYDNKLSDLGDTYKLKNLKKLNCSYNNIKYISGNFKKLTMLSISNNPIEHINDIILYSLEYLYIIDTLISVLDIKYRLPNLESIHLTKDKIKYIQRKILDSNVELITYYFFFLIIYF